MSLDQSLMLSRCTFAPGNCVEATLARQLCCRLFDCISWLVDVWASHWQHSGSPGRPHLRRFLLSLTICSSSP